MPLMSWAAMVEGGASNGPESPLAWLFDRRVADELREAGAIMRRSSLMDVRWEAQNCLGRRA